MIARKRGNSVKFTGERQIFIGEVPLFTGGLYQIPAVRMPRNTGRVPDRARCSILATRSFGGWPAPGAAWRRAHCAAICKARWALGVTPPGSGPVRTASQNTVETIASNYQATAADPHLYGSKQGPEDRAFRRAPP